MLRLLGLGQAKTIDVWPAGLAAVAWDGEGQGEWLASEWPCLAIRTDHPVAAIRVSMGNDPDLELTSVKPGEPIFVELPQLPVGLHTVRIATRAGVAEEVEPLGKLNVLMRIREVQPWSPGISSHGPLQLQMEPNSPTLEQLWEGRLQITLLGPMGRNVKCTASFLEKDQVTATFAKQLQPVRLPVTSNGWRGHFEKHFRNAKEAQAAYDTARVCVLQFRGEELGAFTLRCEREFTPLRWAIRRERQGYIARLIDDSGDSAGPVVGRMAFESPFVEETFELVQEYRAPAAGGMYVARVGEFTAAVIIPPTTVRGFADLSCDPRIDAEKCSFESVLRAVEFARLWGDAKLSGDILSTTRQRIVLRAIIRRIYLLIGGVRWVAIEARVEGRDDSALIDLKLAVSKHREEIGIAAALALECSALAAATCEARVKRVASLATSFRLLTSGPAPRATLGLTVIARNNLTKTEDPEWLAEFALRLASDPSGIMTWAGQHLRQGLTRLFELPTLARATRFLVIATDRQLQSRAATGELYAGWRWK